MANDSSSLPAREADNVGVVERSSPWQNPGEQPTPHTLHPKRARTHA